MEAHWKRTRISSLCLLSLCSKFLHHLKPPLRRSFSRYPNTVQVSDNIIMYVVIIPGISQMLAELFNSEVKQLITSNEKLTLENRGLILYGSLLN